MAQIYQYLDDYLGKKQDRPAPDNQTHTRITRETESRCIHVVYRGTRVVSADLLGNITLRTGGWETRTTRARMDNTLKRLGAWDLSGEIHWNLRIEVTGSITTSRGRPKDYRPWLVVARCYGWNALSESRYLIPEVVIAEFDNNKAIFFEGDIPTIHMLVEKEKREAA